MEDRLATLSPKAFPPLLREIPDAPKKLFVRGTLPSAELHWLAIVGSRAATPYGRQVVRHIVEGLRGKPIAIVSGLAYGIDAEAHKAAITAGLPTIAVPGSGLDWNVLYPRANVNLAREILKKGGALLSEFEPETVATPYTFPQRNRVMAGMSRGTLVIEAKERSGSLITARLTTEYNRELFVIPGSIFSDASRGTHQFLKLGATPVTEAQDILRAFGLAEEKPAQIIARGDLSPDEERVLQIVASAVPRDELLKALSMPITEANILLSTMEIKGLIIEELGVVRIR